MAEGISNFSRLRILRMEMNNVKTIPGSFTKLTGLREFQYRDNPLDYESEQIALRITSALPVNRAESDNQQECNNRQGGQHIGKTSFLPGTIESI